MKKLIGLVIVIVLAIWGVSALNKAPSETGPLKIGFVGPLSGDAASYGEAAVSVAQIALDKINAEGGINGRQVELVVEDAKCDGATSVSATQKLINIDKVKVITGYICSGETIPAVPLVKNGEAFLLSLTASSPELTDISKYFARVYPSDAGQSTIIANKAELDGSKKVAILHESTDYSVGVVNAFKKEFNGETIIEAFASEVTDLRTSLSKLQASGAGALFISIQTPASGEKVLAQLSKMNWKPRLYIDTVLSTSKDLTEKYSVLLEGAYSANFYLDQTNPELLTLRAEYAKRNNGAAIPFESYMSPAYDGILMIKDAIEASGENPTKLGEWFHSVNGWNKGSSGPMTIDKTGDRTSGNMLIVIKNGKYEYVK